MFLYYLKCLFGCLYIFHAYRQHKMFLMFCAHDYIFMSQILSTLSLPKVYEAWFYYSISFVITLFYSNYFEAKIIKGIYLFILILPNRVILVRTNLTVHATLKFLFSFKIESALKSKKFNSHIGLLNFSHSIRIRDLKVIYH